MHFASRPFDRFAFFNGGDTARSGRNQAKSAIRNQHPSRDLRRLKKRGNPHMDTQNILPIIPPLHNNISPYQPSLEPRGFPRNGASNYPLSGPMSIGAWHPLRSIQPPPGAPARLRRKRKPSRPNHPPRRFPREATAQPTFPDNGGSNARCIPLFESTPVSGSRVRTRTRAGKPPIWACLLSLFFHIVRSVATPLRGKAETHPPLSLPKGSAP